MLTASHTFNIFSDGSIENAVQVGPQYARVRHCSESPVTGYRRYMTWRGFVETTGKGDPSVFQITQIPDTGVIYLTPTMQRWIFGLLKESAWGTMTEAQLLKAWENLTAWNKAFTNKKGREQGFADYILHVNETSSQGLGYVPVIATGATVRKVGKPFVKYGKTLQGIACLDVTKPETYKATIADNWDVIFPATNSLNLDNQKERIDPFPKMYNDRDTPWPLLGNGTDVLYIESGWLEDCGPFPQYPYMPLRETGSWNADGKRKDF